MPQVTLWNTTTRSPEETYRRGRLLGLLLRPGHWVLLEGPVGAGKTVFVQGVGAGLGVEERVTSPTFTLVHHYGYGAGDGGDSRVLIHADLYRLKDPAEAEALALDEGSARAPVIVEWWRRAEDIFPPGRLEVRLARPRGGGSPPSKDGWVRHLECRAGDEGHARLLRAWKAAVEASAQGDDDAHTRD